MKSEPPLPRLIAVGVFVSALGLLLQPAFAQTQDSRPETKKVENKAGQKAKKPAAKPKAKAVAKPKPKAKPKARPKPKPKPEPVPVPTPRTEPAPAPAPKSSAPPKQLLSHDQAHARHLEGLDAERAGNDHAALRAFQEAAESGYAPAQYKLGEIYDQGNSAVQRDYATSLGWYQKAREQGVPIPRPHTYPGGR